MDISWGDIEKRVKQIIANTLSVPAEEVNLEASFFDDLGADSLAFVELVMTFEDEFNIEVADEEAVNITSVEELMEYIVRALPDVAGTKITSQVLAFRVSEDGKIQVGLQTTDGTWLYRDGTSFLPAGIYLTVFSKWGDILKELEEMINSPRLVEQDLQDFFEKYPELLKCDEYNVCIPQARIITEAGVTWRADFVLHPFDQNNFCKVLELKLPQASIIRQHSHGHLRVYNELLLAINQLKDYGEAFHSTVTRHRFKQKYKIDIFKPDLQLIAGRKWDIVHMKNMLEVQKRNGVRVDDWDTCLDKLRRQFT